MDVTKPSIVFFGAGPVALASVKSLHEWTNIELVVTKPDPASSRAPRLVKDWAHEQAIPYLQPTTKQELDEQLAKQRLKSQIGIVVDYGFIIPEKTIDRFTFGIINSHFSILPQWRGADPITFSLLSGQPETGVSIMQIVAALDEGDLLSQARYTISPQETNQTLTDKLVRLSNQELQRVIPDYLAGKLQPYPQPEHPADHQFAGSYSRKLSKADGRIDWHKHASKIEREVRAFLGWPGSYTEELFDRRLIITKALLGNAQGTPGCQTDSSDVLEIFCGQGSLIIEELKPAGKPAMSASAFLRGIS